MAKRRSMHQRILIQRAVASLTEGLQSRGIPPNQAYTFARLILTRPGVKIGAQGQVKYHGRTFQAADFATSNLASYVTGKHAEQANRAAIRRSSTYQSEIGQVKAQRDATMADVLEQRNRAILDWGDPTLAASDPLLAAQAAANPFSTRRLIQRQYEQNQLAAQQAANRAGTYAGGGEVSGQQEAGRQHAAVLTDATTQLTDLLSGLTKTQAGANQALALGRQQASIDAYNALVQSGGLHPAVAPSLARLRATGAGFHFLGARPGVHAVTKGPLSMTGPAPGSGQVAPLRPRPPWRRRRRPYGTGGSY